jgi:RNA polymerase sigma factor (TIGR02999 family)
LALAELTALIHGTRGDDGVAVDALWKAAYDELKRLAHARLVPTGNVTLLDTTALVNESYLKLAARGALKVGSRGEFFAYASRVMRSVIVDLVRERLAECRGGGLAAITLDTRLADGLPADAEALHVDEALDALATVEPRLAQVVEMRYFGGLTESEIARSLGLTERTVRRDWDKARALLRTMLS